MTDSTHRETNWFMREMTLIKDLIDIPDRVQRGDFVLKLTEEQIAA
jgi:hypothetical protein